MAELITMTNKELSRYEAIKRLIRKEINGTEAAKQLNLSTRQIRRLKTKVKRCGAKGIIHGNRGKESNHGISEEKIKDIEEIVKKKYYDFGPTFTSEKLEENHQIKISNEKLRQLMISWKLWRPRPRKKNGKYRSRRPRKEYFGEMEQFDGSYHEWFEKRGSKCCLLASILSGL
jgi:regulator of replication initiation timing